MTIQVVDEIEIEGERFDVLAYSGGKPFLPADHGLNVTEGSSACYRGYICTFSLRDSHLHLLELFVNLAEGSPPVTVLGLTPSEEKNVYLDRMQAFRTTEGRLPFTGGILAGRRAGAGARTHVELVFRQGELTLFNDCSECIQAIREKHGSWSWSNQVLTMERFLRGSASMEEFCAEFRLDVSWFKPRFESYIEDGEHGLDDFWERCQECFKLEYAEDYWEILSFLNVRSKRPELEDEQAALERELERLQRQLNALERQQRENFAKAPDTRIGEYLDSMSPSIAQRAATSLYYTGRRLIGFLRK